MKTFTRFAMLEEHLSDLAVIAMNYDERVSVEEVYHAFIQSHPRRIFQASLLVTLCTCGLDHCLLIILLLIIVFLCVRLVLQAPLY